MFEKDRSIRKASNQISLSDQIKNKITFYSDRIAQLQKENYDLNIENQVLANKYSELALFNQELGNDLACFDQDIENLEIKVDEKNSNYKKLIKDSESLKKEFENCRKLIFQGSNDPNLLKSLEKKKEDLIRNFQTLNSDKVDVDSYDIIKARAEISMRIRNINDNNQELKFQINLLKTLLNDKFSISEKRDLLNNALMQKQLDRKSIENQIYEIQNKERSTEDAKSVDKLISEKNELADDEEMDSVQSNDLLIRTNSRTKISRSNTSNSEFFHTQNTSKLKIIKPTHNDNEVIINYKGKNQMKDSNYRQLSSIPSKKAFSDLNRNHRTNSEVIRKKGQTSRTMRNDQIATSSSSSSFFYESQRENGFSTPKAKNGLNGRLAEVQVNESDFSDDEFRLRDEQMKAEEASNRRNLHELENQQKAREETKLRLHRDIENSRAKLSLQSKVNSLTLPEDPLKDIIRSKWMLSIANQTELTGDTIDFHAKILKQQQEERDSSAAAKNEIEELKAKIQELNEGIEQAKLESQRRDVSIQKVQTELEEIQAKIESENDSVENSKKRMKAEFSSDIKKLKDEIRSKQAILQSTTEENAKANEKLDELIHEKNELEHEIEELAFKEKPQIEELSEKVLVYQKRVEESKSKLMKAREELDAKKNEYESVRNSNEYNLFKNLSLKKKVMERRIVKWKMLLKDSSETVQSMEQFSSENIERRKNLKEAVQKFEELKFLKEEELSDIEQFSILLESMLSEQKNNWS